MFDRDEIHEDGFAVCHEAQQILTLVHQDDGTDCPFFIEYEPPNEADRIAPRWQPPRKASFAKKRAIVQRVNQIKQ